MKHRFLSSIGLILLGTLACGPRQSPRMRVFPPLMLWAWERPEELSDLPVSRVGVAFLAQTILLKEGTLSLRPRFQPLRVPPGTKLMAVTRIEVAPPLSPSTALRDQVVTAILGSLRPGILGVQVDFDARKSERAFYADVLSDLRKKMDPSMPLSMTALASWGLFDHWIQDLPVDEAVPMAFDMGSDDETVRHWLAAKKPMREPASRRAFGICLQEPLPWYPRTPRLYIFSHHSWDTATMQRALKEFEP